MSLLSTLVLTSSRHSARLLTVALLAACVSTSLAQTLPGSLTSPDSVPAAATTPASAPTAPRLELPTSGPSVVPAPLVGAVPATTAPAFQPFIGVVSASHVYVRSGPGQNYYELGQLSKGDTLEVIGKKGTWDIVSAPSGVFTLIAKEFVDVDATGNTATVKAEFVNVRAGSALHPASDYAVLTVVKAGTTLTILGSTDKYYKIIPPAKTGVYVSASFIKPAGPQVDFVRPTLKLPAGVNPLGAPNAIASPTTQPAGSATASTLPAPITTPATTEPMTVTVEPAPGTPPATTEPTVVNVIPTPAIVFSSDSYSAFNSLNKLTQAEFQKPLLKRDLKGLQEQYTALAAKPDAAPSVKQGSQAWADSLAKMISVQQAAASAQADINNVQTQSDAINERFKATDARMAEAERVAPYLAEGVLKSSTALADKYVLVNPTTGRVAAYIDPESAVNVSKLLGEYVGVKGKLTHSDALGVDVIRVKTITELEAPK